MPVVVETAVEAKVTAAFDGAAKADVVRFSVAGGITKSKSGEISSTAVVLKL